MVTNKSIKLQFIQPNHASNFCKLVDTYSISLMLAVNKI